MSGINNYFSNNNIFNGTEIPTQGKFDVGDIIVNIGENAEEEPMWMCIEAGEPGVWKVVGKVGDIDLSGYQEKTDENLATKSKDLVGAINELFQNANNGKELIANAIGEPVSADDTFSAMSNDINGLLSTFKTNMMNNGVTVESNDKFKQLIDKIATMAEEDTTLEDSLRDILENKGIEVTTEDDLAGLISKVDNIPTINEQEDLFVVVGTQEAMSYFRVSNPTSVYTALPNAVLSSNISIRGVAKKLVNGKYSIIGLNYDNSSGGTTLDYDLNNNTLVNSGTHKCTTSNYSDTGESDNGERSYIYSFGSSAGSVVKKFDPSDLTTAISSGKPSIDGSYGSGICGGFDGTTERLFISSSRTDIRLDEINPETFEVIKSNTAASCAGPLSCCVRNNKLYIYLLDYKNYKIIEFDCDTLTETGYEITIDKQLPLSNISTICMVNLPTKDFVIDGKSYSILK